MQEGRLQEAPQNRSRPGRDGPVPLQGVEARREGRPRRQPRLLRGAAVPLAHRLSDHPEPGDHLSRAEGQGHRLAGPAGLTALQFKRQAEFPAFRKAYNKYQLSRTTSTRTSGSTSSDPRFADKRVRQAFAHAINKRELIDGVRLGLGREATGPVQARHLGVQPERADVPVRHGEGARAPRRRRVDAPERRRHPRQGRPAVRSSCSGRTRATTSGEKVAEIVQASLKEIGVEVDIQVIEWASFLKEYIKKRRFEAIVLGWGIGLDPDQFEVWHSSKTGPDDLNRIGYANPEVDEMLEKGAPPASRRSASSTTTGSRRSWPRTSRSSSCTSADAPAGGLFADPRHRAVAERHPLQLQRVVRSQAPAALHGRDRCRDRPLTLE